MPKKCSKCGEVKDGNQFYPNRRVCKDCYHLQCHEWRMKHLEWHRECCRNREKSEEEKRKAVEVAIQRRNIHPEETKARLKVHRAVKQGKLEKPTHCECCGEEAKAMCAHHHDYDKPYEVIWLCPSCHRLYHNGKWEAKEIREKVDAIIKEKFYGEKK